MLAEARMTRLLWLLAAYSVEKLGFLKWLDGPRAGRVWPVISFLRRGL